MVDRKRIQKLPKWTQNYIAKLERDVASWKRSAFQVNAGKDGAISWSMLLDNEAGGIPEDATVRMVVENGYIDLRLHDGIVEVYGSRQVLIIPRAANAFHIAVSQGW
jgi:hypothetical protein